jgi:hypothetical protein
MRKSSDGFPIVVTLVAFVLMFLGRAVYERLAYDWIMRQLAPWIDAAQAQLIERISAIAVPAAIALLVMRGFYLYARLEFIRQAERAARRPRKNAWQDQDGVERDVWLYDAVCRIFLGRWDEIPLKAGKLDLDGAGFPVLHDLIAHHVRQLASDGRLPVWARSRAIGRCGSSRRRSSGSTTRSIMNRSCRPIRVCSTRCRATPARWFRCAN